LIRSALVRKPSCVLLVAALLAGCAKEEQTAGTLDCTFRSKCPNETQRTKADVDLCNAERNDKKCGASYTARESCFQLLEECLPNGKINREELELDCKSSIASYNKCRPPVAPADAAAD
jgi:hypothetical protein